MDELNRTAIIIVRNPFAAIIGHRHLVSEISNFEDVLLHEQMSSDTIKVGDSLTLVLK